MDQPRRTAQRPNSGPAADSGGRPLPHHLDAELSVNATLFVHPKRWFDIGSWLKPEDFFDARNGVVYGAISRVIADEGAVNPLTIKARLEAEGTWTRVGAEHLERIMTDGAIHEPLLERVAGIVANKAKVRRTIALAQQVANEGYGVLENDRAWSEEVPSRFDAVVQAEGVATGASARDTLIDVYKRWETPDDPSQVRLGTGLPDLDRLFRKMRPKQLIVIGAHSGIGKSALAANIADHVALNERPQGLPSGVLIFSAEMGREEYIERMVFARAGVDTYKIDDDRKNQISPDEWQRITEATRLLAVDHLYIDDRADITPSQIRIESKRVQMRFARANTPLRLVVIDYAQIISGDAETRRKSDNREQEIAQVARAAKKLAKELGVTVILLAQLNEDSVKEKRRPRAGDLRESRSLKQDADKVVLIYNPFYADRAAAFRNGETKTLREELVEMIVDKNRGGTPGTVVAEFWPSYTLFLPFNGDESALDRLREAGGKANKSSKREGA